jgi:hypothetical protein
MREAAAYITKLEIEVKLAGAGIAPEPDLSERMGDQDTLSWLLASYFSGDRQPHMSGDPRARLSSLRRRDLDDAVQSIIASGFAQVWTEMDYITHKPATSDPEHLGETGRGYDRHHPDSEY